MRDTSADALFRFDLRLTLAGSTSLTKLLPGDLPRWAVAARDDLLVSGGGALRKFLWRYGRGVKRQRGSFMPLCTIHELAQDDEQSFEQGAAIAELLLRIFPEPDDATDLKQDLVDGAVAPAAQVHLITSVLAEHENGNLESGGLPEPTPAGIARLSLTARQVPDRVLDLAERATGNASELARILLDAILPAIPSAAAWSLTESHPKLRIRLLGRHPELLDRDEAAGLPTATLIELIATIPRDAPYAARLSRRLTVRDDQSLAEVVLDRLGEAAAVALMSAVSSDIKVSQSWIRALVSRPDLLLLPSVMVAANRTSMLYAIAEGLGWLTPLTIAAGPGPWLAALESVQHDLTNAQRDMLRSFLLALALANPGDPARRALERFFEPVHNQMLKSELPWQARDLLTPFLPNLGWKHNWDLGKRLRTAVAQTFIANHYDLRSFAMLAVDGKIRRLLAETVDELPGGKRYAKAAG